MIKKTYGSYKNFGKTLKLSDGIMELDITLDLGPRIIGGRLVGKDNVFFEDSEDSISKGGEFFDTAYGKGQKWHLYGGHRLWKSPEDLFSYTADNGAVEVKETQKGVILGQDDSKVSGFYKEIEIKMKGGGEAEIIHRFTNKTRKILRAGLWALSVMAPGGELTMPLNSRDKDLLPARNFVQWSYNDQKDERLFISDDYLELVQKDIDRAFKLGLYSEKGLACYIHNGTAFVKRFPAIAGGNYPDYHCNFETYTCRYMLECETLSPVYEFAPGKMHEHKESWQFLPAEGADPVSLLQKLK